MIDNIQTDNGRKKFGVGMLRAFQLKTSILIYSF